MRSSSCARTTRSARCSTWWASRPSSPMASRSAIFRTIPGLEQAEFARLGGLHRNTFINSPRLLDGELRLKALPHIRFAGQITGVEGYVESAAIGMLAGRFAAAGAARRDAGRAAAHDRARRAARPHHRRRRGRDLPADERQFRPLPAARARASSGPSASPPWRAARSPTSTPGSAAPPRRREGAMTDFAERFRRQRRSGRVLELRAGREVGYPSGGLRPAPRPARRRADRPGRDPPGRAGASTSAAAPAPRPWSWPSGWGPRDRCWRSTSRSRCWRSPAAAARSAARAMCASSTPMPRAIASRRRRTIC